MEIIQYPRTRNAEKTTNCRIRDPFLNTIFASELTRADVAAYHMAELE